MYREYNFDTRYSSYSRGGNLEREKDTQIIINNEKIILKEIDIKTETIKTGLLNNAEKSKTQAKGKNGEEYLKDLLYVKIQSVWFQFVLCIVILILLLIIYSDLNAGHIASIPNHVSYFIIGFVSTIILTLFFGVPHKMIKMYFKGNKKYCFKYYIWNKKKEKSFIEDLKNQNIKIKNINKRNNIMILVLIILNLVFITIKWNEINVKNKSINAIVENKYYELD